ncbi:MAG: class I SAM-dependent methyltransferase [Candidatus Omnitrophica bacterium]|nr:class I SAM-dependent methyltransferase [Candidatus Omnitrophota bacterium]
MSGRTDDTWRDPEMARKFLDEIAGAIPFEAEQLDIMKRLIRHQRAGVGSFLDIGCGNGILAAAILEEYPDARATLLDFSDIMLSAAEEKLSAHKGQARYIKSDYGDEALDEKLAEEVSGFDVIVSRFSIHHQTDQRKQQLYKEIFNLLAPGGIFINIEHVASGSQWNKGLFEEYMIDYLYASQRKKGTGRTREDIAREFRSRHDKDANIVASIEKQCEWFRQIGFSDVDCSFRVFELAIFSGRRINSQ